MNSPIKSTSNSSHSSKNKRNVNSLLIHRTSSGRSVGNVSSPSSSPISPTIRSIHKGSIGMLPLHSLEIEQSSPLLVGPPISVTTTTHHQQQHHHQHHHSLSSSSLPTHPFTRIKRFQLCIWITVIVAFIHLFSKSAVVVTPEHYEPKVEKEVVDETTTPSSTTKTKTTKPVKTKRTKPPRRSKPTDPPRKVPSQPSSPPPTKPSSKIGTNGNNVLDDNSGKDNEPTLDGTKPITPPSPSSLSPPKPSATSKPSPTKKPTKGQQQQEQIMYNVSSSRYTILPSKTDNNTLWNNPQAMAFVTQYCDLSNVKELYPSQVHNVWRQRAPYFILAGVWNAGVEGLKAALLQHPQIDPSKMDGSFLPKHFDRYYTKTTTTSTTTTGSTTTTTTIMNIKVFAARERMYAQAYSPSTLRDDNNNNGNSDVVPLNNNNNHINEDSPPKNRHVAMDYTPGLFFYAHNAARSVLCVTPWAKVVVVLRNPIDRAYQQWVYSRTKLRLTLSLEDWMAREMKLLQSTGLVATTTASALPTTTTGEVGTSPTDGNNHNSGTGTTDKTVATISEREAWARYQSVRAVAGVIGRGLYVLQVQEWIDAYIEAGKVPSEEMIILIAEDIEDDPMEKYNQLVNFLGLAPYIPQSSGTPPTTTNDTGAKAGVGTSGIINFGTKPSVPKDLEPMAPETRKLLQRFYQPYNRRLATLLESNGFVGDWDHLWK